MFFKKGSSEGFFKKGAQILHNGVKGLAQAVDNPLFGAGVAAVAPQAVPAYAAMKASGVLQRLK